MEGQREALINLKEQHRTSLESARQRWQSTHEESHGIALQLESISSQRAYPEKGKKRNQMQLENTQRRCEDLRHSLGEYEKPVQGYKEERELKLKEKV